MKSRTVWIVHLLSLVGVVIWMMCDLRFEVMVSLLLGVIDSPTTKIPTIIESVGGVRIFCLGLVVLLAFSTLVLAFGGLFGSSKMPRTRSIASLLAITTVFAVWCGIAIHYPALAWQGKRVRVAVRIQQFESLVDPLRVAWPEHDGELPGIGPFMAYPFGKPTTLVLLRCPTVSGEKLCIAAIERAKDGSIKLQLSGGEHDDWTEWHPPGSFPQSFIGGLADQHHLRSATSLGRGWYLVRYASADYSPS